ncbi:Dbl homology domain-containing protein [Basidiobolus meristosporus CBS 931.73]|uniref:Dbl homology domain-containing protein n=1 Tax=Basidiobolus meristosporus CBS 931.73 TaxID=1314790 RepID=A0A1Y1Y022_9FUNG|nr:Dbl homology domain-containing protein [Basidiobolus meristosporus CBS 931.73]|eukprot:ORX91351.1 Dbl homology domain-containing protein [Basidiobolus meristosporus CBS 931.73]
MTSRPITMWRWSVPHWLVLCGCSELPRSSLTHSPTSPQKFTTIKISGNMLKTSNASYIGKHIPSNSRHKILLYYILEKYLEKVETDIEILQEWEKETLGQTFKRTTINRLPLTYSKTATFHPIEYNDVVVEISAKAFKHDLYSIVAKLEQVKEASIIPVLKSLEAKLINKSFHMDVIFIDSDKSPELEETWDDFQAICGTQLELQTSEHIPLVEAQFVPPAIRSLPSEAKKVRTPEEMEKERRNAFYELMETEKNHVKRLWSLMNTYVLPLRRSAESGRHAILRKYHLNKIFTNIEAVIKIHEEFLEDLQKLEANEARGLGKTLLHNLTKFGPIKSYVLDYPSALKHSNTLAKSEASYREFLKRVLENPNCLELPELLGTPCQRISKYIVLFDMLFSNTSQQHPDYRPLKKAYEQLKEIASLYESPDSESVKVLHQLYRIIEDCPPDIISGSRKFITQFVVQEVDFTVATPLVQLTFFLFNDRLLIARAKSQEHLLTDRKKPYEFVGWISLVGLSWYEMDSLAQTGFYIHAHAEYVEDEYWIAQRLRSFISPNVKEKECFRLQLEAAKALTKAEKTNAIPFHLQHRGADIYLNIYHMEDYLTSRFKVFPASTLQPPPPK